VFFKVREISEALVSAVDVAGEDKGPFASMEVVIALSSLGLVFGFLKIL
jgi:hypothetical protein